VLWDTIINDDDNEMESVVSDRDFEWEMSNYTDLGSSVQQRTHIIFGKFWNNF
jgi:hypothetical protein